MSSTNLNNIDDFPTLESPRRINLKVSSLSSVVSWSVMRFVTRRRCVFGWVLEEEEQPIG